MKTHTIKTPTVELLIVELQTKVINSSYHIQKTPKGILIKDDTGEKFISNKYTLLGKPDEISEEYARLYVQKTNTILGKYESERWFINYKDGGHFLTGLESFFSLIESEIYWDVNPYESKVDSLGSNNSANGCALYRKAFHEFCEAEEKTFNRKRTLIFKKN